MKTALEGAARVRIRSDLHIARRTFHALGVGIILLFYHFLNRKQMLVVAFSFTAACLLVDFSRLKFREVNEWMLSIFGGVIRRNELLGFTGMTFMAMGVTAIIVIFPKDVTTLALLMLALGDPLSSIFGIMYGKDILIGKKTLQGTLAGFTVCAIVSFIYFTLSGLMAERSILAALVSGLIGAISELTPIFGLDDNFTFPIMSACLLWIQFQIM